jgi:hypothetical protein
MSHGKRTGFSNNSEYFAEITAALARGKERLAKTRERRIKEIADLPKGSVYIGKRRSSEYYYLVHHNAETKKAVFEYLGKKDFYSPDALRERLEERKAKEKELRVIELDLETIDRMLKILNKRNQTKEFSTAKRSSTGKAPVEKS